MFNDAIRGMELASKYGILGGIIAVVTDVTVMQDPAKFFDYLVNVCPRAENTPCWDVGSDGEKPAYTVESQAFLDFTTAMFDHYWKLDDPQRRMRMFHGFIQGLLGGKELTCSFKGNCGDFLSVEADGSIYPCGKFSGVPEFYLGNINEQPLSEILENPVYEAWLNQRSCIPQKCQGCKFAQACNNGCTYERYQGNGQFAELSPYCDVWYGLYEHIGGRITELQTALEAQKA